MNTRSAAVSTFLVLLVAVTAVQLADPQLQARQPPEVTFSDPPAKVAAEAATQFEYVDYAYQIDFRWNRSDEWRQAETVRVANSNRKYIAKGPLGSNGTTIYGNSAVTFVRPGTNESWQVAPNGETVYPALGFTQPLDPRTIREANVTVTSDNSSTLLVRTDSNSLKFIQDYPGTSSLYINRDSGLIERADFEYKVAPNQTQQIRFRVLTTGQSVQRPKSLPFSLREYFWDLLRGPLIYI